MFNHNPLNPLRKGPDQSRELIRLLDKLEEQITFPVEEILFDKQINFIRSESTFKSASCSRRAGKTFAMSAYLIDTALNNHGSTCVYIALTRRSAKLLLWSPLQEFNRKYNLGIEFNSSELLATFPNGSKVILTGAEDQSQIEKLRGLSFKLAIIDEAQSFKKHITILIEEVIEPALIDVDGTLVLIGTPNAACMGYFHDVSLGIITGWNTFAWTMFDNPHIKKAREYIENKKKQKGWTDDNPVLLREWFGRWVKSADSLIYKFEKSRNTCTKDFFLSSGGNDCSYVLGVDLGFDDHTAFVVIAFFRDVQKAYVIECFKQTKMTPDIIAKKIKSYLKQYDILKTVVDTGGLGKMIVEEMNKRHGLNLRAAEKVHKFDFIEMMNDDLRTGNLVVVTPAGNELCDEWELLQYDEDRLKEDGKFENHLADSCLYAWRESRHYLSEIPELLPEVGSIEYFEKIEDEMFMQELEHIEEDQERPFWE